MSLEEPQSHEIEPKLSDAIDMGRWVGRLDTGQKLTDSAVQGQQVDNERLAKVLQRKAQQLRIGDAEFAANELDAIVTTYFGERSVGHTPVAALSDISLQNDQFLGSQSQAEVLQVSKVEDSGAAGTIKETVQSEVQRKLGSVVSIIQDLATKTNGSIPQAIREQLQEINQAMSSQSDQPEIENAIKVIQDIIDTEFAVDSGWTKAWFQRWNNLENMLYDLQRSNH